MKTVVVDARVEEDGKIIEQQVLHLPLQTTIRSDNVQPEVICNIVKELGDDICRMFDMQNAFTTSQAFRRAYEILCSRVRERATYQNIEVSDNIPLWADKIPNGSPS